MSSTSIQTVLPVGTTTTPSVTVNATDLAKTITLSFGVTNWVDGTTLAASVQLFLNGTWQQTAAWTLNQRGTDMNGNPATATAIMVSMQNALPDTQIRGVVTITGNPLQTTITATAE